MNKNSVSCCGTLEAIDLKTGKTVFKVHNMFVQTGLNEIAKFVAKKSPTAPSHIAVGTSSTAPSLADVGLKGSQLARIAFEAVEQTNGTVKFTATFAAGVGTGVWEETGIFTAATGGILFSRAVTGTYTKKDKDEIKIIWTYQFNDASAA